MCLGYTMLTAPLQSAPLAGAFEKLSPVPREAVSEAQLHDHMLGIYMARHVSGLAKDHPDRAKLMLESARLRAGGSHDSKHTYLTDLSEPYELPHAAVRAKRELDEQHRSRFEREQLSR